MLKGVGVAGVAKPDAQLEISAQRRRIRIL
jgi:hypothetical protein